MEDNIMRKRTRKLIEAWAIFFLLLVVGFCLTALVWISKGEIRIGGEVFLPAVPFLLWFGIKSIPRRKKAMKEIIKREKIEETNIQKRAG